MPLVNDDLDLSYYINCKKLVCCYIGLANEIEHHKLDKNITLWKLLGCCPKVKHLYLDGAFLRHIAAGNSPERLPADQLNSLGNQIVDNEKILNYLKEPDLIKQSVTGLQTVIMLNFQGSTCELLLVKLLLAYSPSLKRMCIEENQGLDPIERLNTSKQLMRFSRASPKAEMIFQLGIET